MSRKRGHLARDWGGEHARVGSPHPMLVPCSHRLPPGNNYNLARQTPAVLQTHYDCGHSVMAFSPNTECMMVVRPFVV